MADPVAISVETLKIDSGCSLEKEFSELRTELSMKLIHVPIMYGFVDLRNQRHFVDGCSCFDYNLRIPSHGISKTSYIGYDIKSSKMIMWSRWDQPSLIFDEIDSMNKMG